MTGRVVFPKVRFGFDDDSRHGYGVDDVHKGTSQQAFGQLERRLLKRVSVKFRHSQKVIGEKWKGRIGLDIQGVQLNEWNPPRSQLPYPTTQS